MAYDFRCTSDMTRHPKFLELRDRCGDASLWAIHALWSFATERRPDGNLHGLSDRLIELTSEWRGESGLFISTMVDLHLIDGDPMQRVIHGWAEHQAWLVGREARSEKAKELAHARWDKDDRKADGNAPRNAPRITDSKTQRNAPIPSHPNSHPIPTQPSTLDTPELGIATVTPDGAPTRQRQKPVYDKRVRLNVETWEVEGLTHEDRQQFMAIAPGLAIDPTIQAFVEYAQQHPKWLQDRLATGAWKAALNTWFRNQAKYSGDKGTTSVTVKVPHQGNLHQQTPGYDKYGREYGVVAAARAWGITAEDIANAE